jgi:K+-sensing histidine kinase KdpD
MNLPRKTRDMLKRYGVALACAGIALLMRRAMPVREGTTIYQLPLTAVVVSGWFGGRGPGLFALAFCVSGILYWLIPPVDSFDLPAEYTLGLCLFIGLGLLLVEFSAARSRVERSLHESDRRFRLIAEMRDPLDGVRHPSRNVVREPEVRADLGASGPRSRT